MQRFFEYHRIHMYNIGNNKKGDLLFLVIHEASKQLEML